MLCGSYLFASFTSGACVIKAANTSRSFHPALNTAAVILQSQERINEKKHIAAEFPLPLQVAKYRRTRMENFSQTLMNYTYWFMNFILVWKVSTHLIYLFMASDMLLEIFKKQYKLFVL